MLLTALLAKVSKRSPSSEPAMGASKCNLSDRLHFDAPIAGSEGGDPTETLPNNIVSPLRSYACEVLENFAPHRSQTEASVV
ncbi:hypothetical protein Y032_0217g2409 [Ancylostoma ceylanicum]|uniref:Uncharacterized protein n=1 Tax=Ancylostoma ceylanicum TaxID=53326 RepID=A0A016SK23_9BILA|nr:hypothetical protein Y032_0217g2409 [Ancylostoma ceylanicum]